MSFRHSLIALALSSALLAGCGKDEPAQNAAAPAEKAAPVQAVAATAATALDAQVRAFRNNDLKSMLGSMLPPAELERIRSEWDKNRQEEISEQERTEFAENWGKLTAPDGVDKIMAEIEPHLAEMKPQMAMMIGMGQMGAQQMITESTDLTDAQKQQLQPIVTGFFGWAAKTDFTDAALMRKSLTALGDGLRATDIKQLDDIKALSFDQLLDKGGHALGGFKNALAVYGFSMDAVADSMKTELVSEAGDTAKVKISYALFDSPISFESEMQKVDGKWYGKDMLAQLEKAKAEAASEVASDDSTEDSEEAAASE